LTENDVIFVMERTQVAEATKRYPVHASRIYLLTALNPSLPIDIADPNGEGPATCQAIFHQIIDALEPVVDCITHQRQRLP
jgi:protein-tyrosine-phosphatase